MFRTLPPAAAPIYPRDILSGLKGMFREQHELDRFQSELKGYFGVDNCLLFSSGKAALAFALLALKERTPERYEVIMPAYVCYSVPSAVVRAGLKVVPCDLKPKTLEMGLDKLSALIKDTTLCVIVPHLFGLPAKVSKIARLCHENGVLVIEDAAQAIGVRHNGKMLGTLGDIAFFSLGRGKTISTVEGGILITKDSSIARTFKARWTQLDAYTVMEKGILLIKALLLLLFARPNLYWLPRLLPFLRLGETIYDPKFPMRKMSGVQAGLARNWEAKLQDFNGQRKKNAQSLLNVLSKSPCLSPLVTSNTDSEPVCLRMPFFIGKIQDKEDLLYESEKAGLGLMFTYPDSIDGIPELRNMVTPGKYPEARRMVQHILTLPVHPLVSQRDIQKIIHLFDKMKPSRFENLAATSNNYQQSPVS